MDHTPAGSATGIDLAALEQLARAATPGPWSAKKEFANRWRIDVEPAQYEPLAAVYGGVSDAACKQTDSDATYIAAANPATVLALIALARATPQHPRPTDDELWDATLRDRDQYHEWADKLAGAIAIHFGVDIGEHSNMNLPWAEALDAIESAPLSAAADAATPQHSVTEHASGQWQARMFCSGDTPWTDWADVSDEYYESHKHETRFHFRRAQPLASTAAQPEQTLIAAVDAAMVEMANISPPLRRSECARLIRAALAIPASTGEKA